MKHLNLKKNLSKGFSLVEMLVVIAVIGVIAAIAIPSIGNINASAKTATAQRNAQSVVSMYQAGQAAGVAWGTTDAATSIAAVIAGGSPTDGAFSGKKFIVPNLGSDDITALTPYVTWDSTDSTLVYSKTATVTGP